MLEVCRWDPQTGLLVGSPVQIMSNRKEDFILSWYNLIAQWTATAGGRLSLSFPSYPEELKRQSAALEETRVELDAVQNQLALARSEIETIKAVATVSENTKQEAIDQIRSQWQEEVASLQAIMKGTHEFTFPNGPRNRNKRQICKNSQSMLIP